jgi:hypothetical protein
MLGSLPVNAEPTKPIWTLDEPLVWDISQSSTIDLTQYVEPRQNMSPVQDVNIHDFQYKESDNYTLTFHCRDSNWPCNEVMKITLKNLTWTGEVDLKFKLEMYNQGDVVITPVNLTLMIVRAKGDIVWLKAPRNPLIIAGISFEYTVEAFSYRTFYNVNYSLIEYPTGLTLNPTSGKISWVTLDPSDRTISVIIAASDGTSIVKHYFNFTVVLLKTTIDYPHPNARFSKDFNFSGTYIGPANGYIEVRICDEGRQYPLCDGGRLSPYNGQWQFMSNIKDKDMHDGRYTLTVRPCLIDNETKSNYCSMQLSTVHFYIDKSNNYVYTEPMFVFFMIILPIICIIAVSLIMFRYLRKK